jgi:GTP-binding protein
MRVQTAEFILSVAQLSQLPKGDWPEIAFAGRSNVGKSSLINRLLGRKGLARTSSTPGRTRMLNFYAVNGALHFVDLPGYGYAKVSRSVQESWWALVEEYLTQRRQLRAVIHLVDARHPPATTDQELQAFLASVGRQSMVVLTKADKVGRGERGRVLRDAAAALPPAGGPPLFVSAETGEGIPELWRWIEGWLKLSGSGAAARRESH